MRLIAIFAAASLPAVVLGALVCALGEISPAVWIRNVAAWLVGALAAVVLAALARRGWLPALLVAAPAALAVTFAGAGLSGVHRWIETGPLRWNASMLVLPMLAVTLACARGGWRWAVAAGCLVLLVLQPDASQATALAAVSVLAALRSLRSPSARVLSVAAAAALAGAAWLRPDPLAPVPEVEGILGLASQISPPLALVSLAALIAAAMAPGLAVRRTPPDPRRAGAALSAGFGVWILAPFLGAFPMPFMGVGPSPIVGAWLGVGLLAGLMRNEARSASATRHDGHAGATP